jgi:hypothetical protein
MRHIWDERPIQKYPYLYTNECNFTQFDNFLKKNTLFHITSQDEISEIRIYFGIRKYNHELVVHACNKIFTLKRRNIVEYGVHVIYSILS